MGTEGMNMRNQSTNGIALENQRQRWRAAKGTREKEGESLQSCSKEPASQSQVGMLQPA